MVDGVFSVCIYCKRLFPEARSSVAHIFPDALGGTLTSDDIVCSDCNGRVNQDVEMAALDQFRLFRSLLGIEGRRGIPGVPGTVTVEGHTIPTVLGPGLAPSTPLVHVEKNDQGKKTYFAYGPDDVRDAFVAAVAKKRPDVNWKTSRYNVEMEIIADGPALEDPILRRLAAKVAFERLAQLRGGSIAADPEFDNVRDFILNGVEALPCCGITADPLLLEKSFNFPVPVHAVVIVFHEADPVLGGFVMFFGLYLFWVILSRRYRALGSVDDLLIEWPLVREAERPLLRSGLGKIRVPWPNYINEYRRDPLAAVRAANQASRAKFKAAIETPNRRPVD
jgi:hypothetical protein